MPDKHLKRIKSKRTANSKTRGGSKTTSLDGSQAQYEQYLPAAMKLAASDVRSARVEVSLVTINAARGVEAVLAHARDLKAALPHIDLATVSTLADLGSALAYSGTQVARFAATPTDVKELLAQARQLRGLLLASADVLVRVGIMSAATVTKIRRGRGAIDTAGDCVALAALFTKHAAEISGKVVVTSADIAAADSVGGRLLRLLRPGSAKKPTDKELVAATDARDRLWTLFERAWENNVWRAGAWLFGRHVDQFVPPLHSRVLSKRVARPSAPQPPPPSPASPVVQ